MTTELAVKPQDIIPGFGSLQSFELIQRAATLLSKSTLVPQQYQGNLPNCVIALNMAGRMNADPLMVMQNLYIVQGRPSWSSQFLIATINTCGRFSALRYEWFGKEGSDEWGCRAWAIDLATGDRLEGSTVSIALAKREGWYQKSGSKWQTMPQQMLMYRAAAWFVRAYAPELAMGMHTEYEVMDVTDNAVDIEREVDGNANGPVIDVEPTPAPEPEQKDEKPTTPRKADPPKKAQVAEPAAPVAGPGF